MASGIRQTGAESARSEDADGEELGVGLFPEATYVYRPSVSIPLVSSAQNALGGQG